MRELNICVEVWRHWSLEAVPLMTGWLLDNTIA